MKTKEKKKKENFVRRTISIPTALDDIINTKVDEQKIHRNVDYSSFVVEILANQLVK